MGGRGKNFRHLPINRSAVSIVHPPYSLRLENSVEPSASYLHWVGGGVFVGARQGSLLRRGKLAERSQELDMSAALV